MRRYLGRRLLVAVPTLLGLSLLIYILISLAPGDPAEELARRRLTPREPTPAEVEEFREQLGLDRPFVVQYLSWLGNAVQGDLGESFARQTPVWEEIRTALPASAELAASAFLLTLLLAVPLGVAAAMLHRHWTDHLMRFLALVCASIPGFFLAYLLIIVFATELGWLPVAGRTGLDSFVLPSLALAVGPTAIVSRLLRSSLLEVFSEDYLRTARAKGLSPLQVVVGHGLRNASVPVVTYLGSLVGALLDGVVIVEVIFAWPGLGRLIFEAISSRDYPMVQGLVIFAGIVYFAMNLLVDLSYRLIDPRIRVEGSFEHG